MAFLPAGAATRDVRSPDHHGSVSRPSLPRPASPLRLEHADIRLLNALAAMQIRNGRPGEAIAWLMQLRRMAPGDMAISRNLALALLRLDRLDEAETVLDEIERRGAAGREGLLWRALLSVRRGLPTQARQLFDRFTVWRN